MPEELIHKPERFVRDMAVGEQAWIIFVEIRVDKRNRSTYVNANAKIRTKESITTVTIERVTDGFALMVKPKEFEFLAYDEIPEDVLPVVEIRVTGNS